MQIIHTSFKNITLSSKLLVLTTPKGEIALDIHQLLNASSDTENAYFNATDMAKLFGKRYEQVTRSDNWNEYVIAVEDVLITHICVIKKMDKKFYNENNSPKAIVSRRGRYGGTWLHQDLAIEFMGLLDVKWKMELHQLFKQIVKQTVLLKVERKATKTLFHQLTDTIKDIYIPAQISEKAKIHAYSSLMNLANKKALGRVSVVVMKDMGITKEQIISDGNISIRDYLSHAELEAIKQAEEDINGLIKYARITDYREIEERLGV